MTNFDIPGPSSSVRPQPYMRFLLRHGEQRGRRLAVLIPSLVYFALALYPLSETVIRTLVISYEPSRGDLIGMGVFAGVGMVGALVNATVMWEMTGPNVTTHSLWSIGLTVPLVLVFTVMTGFFSSTSDTGHVETVARGMALMMILLFGYLRLNTHASSWPRYRPYLPQYHP